MAFFFFSHRPQISNFPPYFRCFSTFSPVSWKLFFPPTLTNFPPCFRQIHLLFTYFTCIYASPNARTGRPCFLLFIHSFIANIYISPLQVGLLRSVPNPSAAEQRCFKLLKEFLGESLLSDWRVNGRPFQTKR